MLAINYELCTIVHTLGLNFHPLMSNTLKSMIITSIKNRAFITQDGIMPSTNALPGLARQNIGTIVRL